MKPNYEPELDGLRAFAIFAVMGFHFAGGFITGGSLGVDVFFVLSGYLITSILSRETEAAGGIDYRNFLMRRASRLLPALAVLLGAYVALSPLLFPQLAGRRWLDVGVAAFYLTNLRETFWPAETPLSHTWSLAIEEQFYIVWPLALLGLLRLKGQTAALVLVGVWAILTLVRSACAGIWPGHPAAYYFTPLHATGLVLGAALALRPISFTSGRLSLIALFGLVILARTSVTFIAVQPVAEVLTALVIANPPQRLAAAPLRFVGRISYGVYLWHIPIMWAVGIPKSLFQVGVLAALSLLAGALSHFGVERWFLKPRTAQTVPSTASA
ncbi:MAG TPA: acyltransferase [Phenylobacterium sp.]